MKLLILLKKRNKVEYFIDSMWKPSIDVATALFSNATIITNKYHLMRRVTWAIEAVRKRLQKTMPASLMKYYKRSQNSFLLVTRVY